MGRAKSVVKKLAEGGGQNPSQMMKERLGGRYSSSGPKISAVRPLQPTGIDDSGVPKPKPIRSVHEKLTADKTKTGEAWGLKPLYDPGHRPDGPALPTRPWR